MSAPVSTSKDSSNHFTAGNFTYLALGDSYTIGQSVPAADNYPNQTINLLEKDSLQGQLKIIATTGWTTDQLKSAVMRAEGEASILKTYDIVTLLIGVNNQYQGQEAASYHPKFEELLKMAITLAGDKANHVIVLSIPDWGATPFGESKEPEKIARDIEAYNVINKQLTLQYGASYIDITPSTKLVGNDSSLLAGDGLHYSGKEYALWAQKLSAAIQFVLR